MQVAPSDEVAGATCHACLCSTTMRGLTLFISTNTGGTMSTVSIRKTHGEDYASIKTVVDQVIADLGGLEDII